MPKPTAREKFSKPKYKRIVLKLSGEALKARGSMDNISPEIVQQVCTQIKDVHALGVEILSTGGTAAAAAALVEKLGGEVVALSFVIELDFLNGRSKLPGHRIESLVHY